MYLPLVISVYSFNIEIRFIYKAEHTREYLCNNEESDTVFGCNIFISISFIVRFSGILCPDFQSFTFLPVFI